MSVDAAKLAALVANLTGGAVADPEALQAVIEDYASKINAKANKSQEAWIAPTLGSAWINYGSDSTGPWETAGYMKDEMGFVRIKGFIKNGTIGTTPIFTLPAGYRPGGNFSTDVFSSNTTSTVLARIYVLINGNVICDTGGNSNLSLFIPSFRAEN